MLRINKHLNINKLLGLSILTAVNHLPVMIMRSPRSYGTGLRDRDILDIAG